MANDLYSVAACAKKIAKVQPMTGERNEDDVVCGEDKNNNLDDKIDLSPSIVTDSNDLFVYNSPTTITGEGEELISCQLLTDTKISSLPSLTSSSSSEAEHSVPETVDRATSASSFVAEEDRSPLLVPTSESRTVSSPSPSSTLSSVYTLNLFDNEGTVASLTNDDEDQRTSYISTSDEFTSVDESNTKFIDEPKLKFIKVEAEVEPPASSFRSTSCNLVPPKVFLLTKESSSLIELCDKSQRSDDDSLDPEVRTLLSSVENLPNLTDTASSYSKKLSSFEEANALLQSFESLDQIVIGSSSGVKNDNNFVAVDENDDEDDDELLISLYENVDEESKNGNSSRKQSVDEKVFNETPPSSQNFIKTFAINNSVNLSAAAGGFFEQRNLKKIEKFTESDEENQSRKATVTGDGYASSDSSSTTKSFGLKIADAIAMFEKTVVGNNNNNKSNPSSRESSLGRSDGRKILTSMMTTTTTSSQIIPSRRPSNFVLVRTPSSYESADENELANSPLFRKQQNLLSDNHHQQIVVVDDMDPLASVESHHRALTASSTSLASAAATVKSFHKSSSTVTSNGSSNLHLYYV